jgi:O-antigen/teichoic acid export membrane protein
LQLGFNSYSVLALKLGVRGILLGNLISIAVSWIILGLFTFRYCGFNFHIPKLKAMGKYCLPFILAAVGGMIIHNADRIMLNNYTNLAVVGIYALAMKFGIGIRELVIEPFTLNFGQSRFAIMKQPQARNIYSRTMTYFVFVIVFVSLGVMFFSKELLMIISAPEFRKAYTVVPLILLSMIFWGMTYVFQTGILIEKKTRYMFFINMTAAILVIVLNMIFIPRISMYGAALAIMLANLVTAVITCLISNSLFKIDYEFLRLTKIFAVASVLYLLSGYLLSMFDPGIAGEVAVKLLFFASFPYILHFVSFYREEELRKLRALKLIW